MKILCLNTWGSKLHGALIPYLTATRPDVLCLQEITHTPGAPQDWLSYRDGGADLPQRANSFTDISEALPDHVGIFCPAAQGDLWDGDQRYASQWGLATFVHKDLPIIAQAQGFVHGSFSPDGYGEHPRSRPGHAIRIYDFARGYPVTIAHMHGLRDPTGKQDTPERLTQAERLKALVRSVAAPEDRLVVCGDFNVTPDSETFRILGDIGLSDLVTARGHTDTRTSHYDKPGRFADYMLVNGILREATFDVVAEPEVSDHRPLVLTLT
ncbi:endonuclease/exonuclease/phosphatase family protein [Lacibacterium aquatile]|uniref:Endonuclease/exonuclease/phosphatase family protein n=1 Tax=Lacibacterium aquatile TaxID=1168082 RepID=A0ABW5DTJ6_9PROT